MFRLVGWKAGNLRFKLFVLLTIYVVGFFLPCFGLEDKEALSALSEAEGKINACYGAATEAEKAGANISALLNVLNEAGWLLSKAKLAYSQKDFGSVIGYVDECQSLLDGFVEHANSLRLEAEQASHRDFLFNFLGSGVGALCIVLGSYAVWILLKKREKRRDIN